MYLVITFCFLLAAPCIDKSQGGPRITRENRAIDWRILITGHPTPEVRWGKNDNNSIDDHRVIQRNETDFDGLIACLSVAKCKVCSAHAKMVKFLGQLVVAVLLPSKAKIKFLDFFSFS